MNKITYIAQSITPKAIRIFTTSGTYKCTINEDHKYAYVQGEEVLVTRNNGRVAVYSVTGGYKRLV